MKSFLFLILYALALPALAGNVVLLSSLKVNKFVYSRMESELKEAYRNSDRKLIIHREVTPEILHKTLTDEETEILIWVSHAGGAESITPGMSSQGIILDYFGNDVKNFFTTTTKNLKFLGIVGCAAQSIFLGFKDRGHYEERPDLSIYAFPRPVQLMTGLSVTIKESLTHLKNEISSAHSSEDEVLIRIDHKTIGGQGAYSWLELGDKVYPLTEEILISEKYWNSLRNKNIKHVRDQSSKAPLSILELASSDVHWQLFASKDGNPLGDLNKHLYVFKKETR